MSINSLIPPKLFENHLCLYDPNLKIWYKHVEFLQLLIFDRIYLVCQKLHTSCFNIPVASLHSNIILYI